MKKLKEMSKLYGTVPVLYSREFAYQQTTLANSHSEAITILFQ